MFETSLDAWYAWLGVATASVLVFGVAIGLPAGATPSPVAAADTVDEVATSPHEAHATVDVPAAAYRIDPHRISYRSAGGQAHATLAYGPVTPASDETLRAVLEDGRPEAVYPSPDAFETALERAQQRDGQWRDGKRELTVRRVTWGEVDATLVG